MIAITTNSSINVKAERERERDMKPSEKDERGVNRVRVDSGATAALGMHGSAAHESLMSKTEGVKRKMSLSLTLFRISSERPALSHSKRPPMGSQIAGPH
jgi:hypothetical protein